MAAGGTIAPGRGGAGSGYSTPIQCGDRLGPGRTAILEADLICTAPELDSDPTTALTVLGPVTFNPKGYTLACGAGMRIGIVLPGRLALCA
jgi:hypothetical protein